MKRNRSSLKSDKGGDDSSLFNTTMVIDPPPQLPKKKATMVIDPPTQPPKKKARKKKKKDNSSINLFTGKGKSVKIRDTVDGTLLKTSMVDSKGYIDYFGHLTNQPNPTTLHGPLMPEMVLPVHENHNASLLGDTVYPEKMGGHRVDTMQLRKTAYFFEHDDEDDYDPDNEKEIIAPKQTYIIKDNETALTTTIDYFAPVKKSNTSPSSFAVNDTREYPIEVLADQGYITNYAFDVTERLKIMSNEFKIKAESIRKENMEDEKRSLEMMNSINKGDGKNLAQPRKRRNNMNSELNSVKLGVPFGSVIQTYSYNIRTYKGELANTIASFNKDKAKRYKKYFLNDPLDGTTAFHQPPKQFAIFRELEEKYKQRFAHRIAMINDSIKNTPKFMDEAPLSKDYIDSYRRRPGKNDQLCSNGLSCCFKTFSHDENITYIGKVFYTRREAKIINDLKKKSRRRAKEEQEDVETYTLSPTNHPTPEEMMKKGINNHRGLCIDCILKEFTIKTYQNIANEEIVERQFNHFTVLCEKNQYSPTVMLPNIHNNRATGITGFVPIYNVHYRVSAVIHRTDMVNNTLVEATTNYIAETGMDF